MTAEVYVPPDAWLLIGLFGAGLILFVAYATGSLADERRQARMVARPLGPDRLVEVDAGRYRGRCGWVRELSIEAGTGCELVKIELSGSGDLVTVPRADVSPLFG